MILPQISTLDCLRCASPPLFMETPSSRTSALAEAVIASPPQTSAEYLALKHVAPYPVASFELGPIDGTLRALKSARHISCFIPEYSLIPNVLIGSDLVFTTCRRFAEDYAKHLPLAVVPAPDFFPKMEFRMLWHEVTQSNPATIWLRRQIQSAAKAGNFEF